MIIVIIIVACIIIVIVSKSNTKKQKQEPATSPIPDIDFTISPSVESKEYSTPIKQTPIGYILNPNTHFELTILNCSQNIATTIRHLCKQGDSGARKELLSIFASYNIKIKEIEEYKNKYKPIYLKRIEEMKATSIEYKNAGLMDKADLLDEFRHQALDSIYELPDFDVEKMFISEDAIIDDELISHYGFDCLNAYLAYYKKIGSVIIIDKDNHYRSSFLKMSQNGLAISGKDIPIADVLSAQTLKTLNLIANNPDKEYKRKNQAIEYILSNQDIVNNLENYIAYRELFKLEPLPDKYAKIDIETILKVWECHKIEIELLIHTFNHSIYSWNRCQDSDIRNRLYSHCSVGSVSSRCQCAKDRSQKKYPIKNPPQTPCHIGCSCWISYD